MSPNCGDTPAVGTIRYTADRVGTKLKRCIILLFEWKDIVGPFNPVYNPHILEKWIIGVGRHDVTGDFSYDYLTAVAHYAKR